MDSGHYYGNAPNKSIAMQDTWYFDERRPTNAKIAYIAITSSCCSAYLHIIVVHFFQFNFFKSPNSHIAHVYVEMQLLLLEY